MNDARGGILQRTGRYPQKIFISFHSVMALGLITEQALNCMIERTTDTVMKEIELPNPTSALFMGM